MSLSAGVREFRQGLAEYIDQTEPVTVTRHGQTVGLFIPVHPDKKAAIDAYARAAEKAGALLSEMGLSEGEAVVEFRQLREAARPADGR